MKLSIVIPVFNEEKVLPHLKERLFKVLSSLKEDYEIIFVSDGSIDQSATLIKSWMKEDERIILLELSRNFGHQPAIAAGLAETTGDAVVILDADLQDPPEKISEMIAKWKEGYKIVLAQRTMRKENFMRAALFKLFYKMFVMLSDLPVLINSGVFGLMDRVVVSYLLRLGESNRYLPGLRGWLGFETATISYEREERFADKPKQSLRRLFEYGFNAIFSFSYKPIRICFVLGCLISLASFGYGSILIIRRVLNIDVVPGFTTPTVAIFFIGGVLLISNGIIGEYLARIYDEVKRRPLFIVARKTKRQANGQVSTQDIEPSR